mmetsp:Transcript_92746/g.203049  ORF Transcript_92746/g.203049 Transcript_92746/m.203049 type:complete len:303 (-) Transcript_92746:464-1372(-)
MGATSSTERRTRNVALEDTTTHLEEVAFMPGKTLLGGTSPLKGAKSHTSPEHSSLSLSESATTVGSATTAACAGDATTTAARTGRSLPVLFPQDEMEDHASNDPISSLKKESAPSKPKKTVSLPSTPSRARELSQGPPLLPIRARQRSEEEEEQPQPDKTSRSRSLFLPIQPRRSYCCGSGNVSSPTPKNSDSQPQGGETPVITKSKSAPLLLPLRSRQEAAQAEAAGVKTPIPMGTGRNSDHTPEMVKEVRSPSTALSATRRKSRRTVTFEGEQCVYFKVERAEDSSPESESANDNPNTSL